MLYLVLQSVLLGAGKNLQRYIYRLHNNDGHTRPDLESAIQIYPTHSSGTAETAFAFPVKLRQVLEWKKMEFVE